MVDGALPQSAARSGGWLNRLLARPGLHAVTMRVPGLRGFARRDGQAIFGIVQGFVESQVLFALVELDLFEALMPGPATAGDLALRHRVPVDRMAALLQAGAALGLLRRRGDRFGLSRRGAAMTGVPGLMEMIRHHGLFYRDMADPVALLQGRAETELARFWPYVAGGEIAPALAERYSRLMADSQRLVAEDTLAAVSFKGVRRLMDVGGGTGVFLERVGRRHPGLELELFDLPEVLATAQARLAGGPLAGRLRFSPGSFRAGALPVGADAVSLVRVLYDHDDDTVRALLARAHAALPEGGRLIVSEPMSGGARPDPVTDVYFAFYTMAMGTGRTRSAETVAALCRAAGFRHARRVPTRRSYVTSVVVAVK
ncbi:MAG: methyltransferase domain-containing protein [Rhodobacteraceae bacterium]|nr:methyltransferase domain-containing protein [Paracoccaceae bacterium]